MAKCKACGEFNPEGSRFCAKCGSSMADDNAVIAEALKEAQKDFDRDSMATLDKSRITYVCSICGSINRIDQPKCTRCGKPRPRSEYVNALKRINQSAEFNAQQETLVAPLPIAAPEQPVEEQAPVAEPLKETPVQAAQPVVANMMVAGGQQGVVAQPFVVVPYVDSMYPLRQYNPNQLYRYQPYTPEELAAIKQQREAEEMRARLAAQQASQATQEDVEVKDTTCKASKKKVRIFAIFTLILSLVMTYFALGCYGAIHMAINGDVAGLDYLFVAGAAIIMVTSVIAVIHSLVRLIGGKRNCRGWVIGLIQIIGYIAYAAGTYFYLDAQSGANDNSMAALLLLVNAIPALIHLILCACSPKKCKCK